MPKRTSILGNVTCVRCSCKFVHLTFFGLVDACTRSGAILLPCFKLTNNTGLPIHVALNQFLQIAPRQGFNAWEPLSPGFHPLLCTLVCVTPACKMSHTIKMLFVLFPRLTLLVWNGLRAEVKRGALSVFPHYGGGLFFTV